MIDWLDKTLTGLRRLFDKHFWHVVWILVVICSAWRIFNESY